MSGNGGFDYLLMQAYSEGYACHGDLGISREEFVVQVVAILERYLGPEATEEARISFVHRLYTKDLYLTIACAQHSEIAWWRFIRTYKKYIKNVARFASPTADAARELADSTFGNLFLPSRSGRSRIALYDGRSSLATWLRILVIHRATNERELKCNGMENIESMPEIVDEDALYSVEAALRTHQYKHIIDDSFAFVCENLASHERLMLLWRYENGLQLGHIARLLGVHQCTVTRQLERIQKRMRDEFITILASRYHLSSIGIEECLAEITENPSHSILNSIMQTPITQ